MHGTVDAQRREALTQLFRQNIADRVFRFKVTGVDQVQAKRRRITEFVVFDIRRDKGIEARSQDLRHELPAGAAAHGDASDGSAPVREAQAGTGKPLLDKRGKGRELCLSDFADADQAGCFAVLQDLYIM